MSLETAEVPGVKVERRLPLPSPSEVAKKERVMVFSVFLFFQCIRSSQKEVNSTLKVLKMCFIFLLVLFCFETRFLCIGVAILELSL